MKQALSDDDYHLIAFHRPKNTEPFTYAKKLSGQINKLLVKGVPADNITIIGFSRGAFITGLTSNLMKDTPINTIILAGCGRLVSKKHDDIQVYGHVLSVYEQTDKANTCKKLKDKSSHIASFKEIEINTGLSHGAFYRPISDWVTPVKQWIKSTKTN